MRLKHHFSLSIKNFFRRKINYLNISLLVISVLLVVFSLSFSKTFEKYIDNRISGHIDQHIVSVLDIDETLDNDIGSTKKVGFVSSLSEYKKYVETSDSKEIMLIGLPDSYLEKMTDKKIISTNNLICPSKYMFEKNITPDTEEYYKKIQNGNKLIDKKMNIIVVNYNKEYTVIDTYDVKEYTYGDYNICFTSDINTKEINRLEIEEIRKECEESNEICDLNHNYERIIYVDKTSDIDGVINSLQAKGYRASRLTNISYAEIDFLSFVVIGVGLILFIVSFSIILISNNKFIQYSKKNNLIYKALGYNNKTLIKLNYCESIIMTFISMIISIIFIFLIKNYIYMKFPAHFEYVLSIYISLEGIIISFVLLLIVPLLSSFLSLMNNNNTIIEELNDGEI